MSARCLVIGLCLSFLCGVGWGQDGVPAIWTPLGSASADQEGECWFRKQFTLVRPERGELQWHASGQSTVYINGHQVRAAEGSDAGTFSAHVTRLLKPGVNLISVHVANGQSPHHLAMKLRIKEVNETSWRALVTDSSWMTHKAPGDGWHQLGHPDLSWARARSIGRASNTEMGVAKSELPVAPAHQGLPTSADRIPGNSAVRTAANRPRDIPVILPTAASVEDPAFNSPLLSHQASHAVSLGDSAEHLIQSEIKLLSPVEIPSANPNSDQVVYEVAEGELENGPLPDEPTPTNYQLPAGFTVEQVLDPAETKSVLAMAFNEFGLILFSQEGGNLMLADPRLPSGQRVRPACEQVRNCQGILPFNGNIYVTGDGPEGLALYELTFRQQGQHYTVNRTLLRFTGQIGEHGPHGLALGPDGLIYVTIGSANYLVGEWPANSPLNQSFDTDLLPKREDPGGHAHGVKAPGGTIVRVSLDGKRQEIVAGGLRNAYDLVFNSIGDLFVHDADMESDLGLPWYQPTLLYHVAHGADLGWRSGWSRVATYLPDTLPPVAETGRGSPTGAVCYRHVQFPIQYHDALFLGDWSAGRIIAVRLSRSGASYRAETETFLQANPLNVTDMDVGEDGSLYFCTGGRGTRGGVYRIRWTGAIPQECMEFKDNVSRVVRHPQPSAAWTRQNLAVLSQAQGAIWSDKLLAAVRDRSYPPAARAQALEAVVFYCGLPDVLSLSDLVDDYSEVVRAKLAQLCGFDVRHVTLLEKLLDDPSPFVVRHACESYLRLGTTPGADKLLEILTRCNAGRQQNVETRGSDRPETQGTDRHLQTVARRLLERIPSDQWLDQVLAVQDVTTYAQAALAAVSSQPSPSRCRQVVEVCTEWLKQSPSDENVLDLLRLLQVTLARERSAAANADELARQLANCFPSRDERVNRELAVLITYLKTPVETLNLAHYFASAPDSLATKTWVAMQFAVGAERLDDTNRLAIIDVLHTAQKQSAAGTYRLYLRGSIRETAQHLTESQWLPLLRNGANWVDALVPIFYKIQGHLSPALMEALIELDKALSSTRDDSAIQARMGIIALLSEGNDETALDYLRQCWRNEPQRRNELALGLARHPTGKNWSYLVTSLGSLDDLTCTEVIDQLITVQLRPAAAEHYRLLLETGYRLQDSSAHKAADLMEHWTQIRPASKPVDWRSRLDFWRAWYQQQWPHESPVSTPISERTGRYSIEQILRHWSARENHAHAERGQQVFVKASCVQCHRVGTVGDSSGPDLSALSRRFSRREAVEATIAPDRVVPDRYRSSLVIDDQGNQYVGLLTDNGDSYSILQTDSRRVRVDKQSVVQIRTLETSVMPSGLLDRLSLDEIVDLMAYLMGDDRTASGLGTDSTSHR